MTNNLIDPLPQNTSGRIACEYFNATSRLQIVRITNVANWYFERVVFPGQRLGFQAFPEALLEVYSYEMVTTVLADSVPCNRIRSTEPLALHDLETAPPKITQVL